MIEYLRHIDLGSKSWKPVGTGRNPRKGSKIMLLCMKESSGIKTFTEELTTYVNSYSYFIDGSIPVGWNYVGSSSSGISLGLATKITSIILDENEKVGGESYVSLFKDTDKMCKNWIGEINKKVAEESIITYKQLISMEIIPLDSRNKKGAILLDRGVVYGMTLEGVGYDYVDLSCPADTERSHKYPMDLILRWMKTGRFSFLNWAYMYGDDAMLKLKNTLQNIKSSI